jgi:hypothetical protein
MIPIAAVNHRQIETVRACADEELGRQLGDHAGAEVLDSYPPGALARRRWRRTLFRGFPTLNLSDQGLMPRSRKVSSAMLT